MLCNTERVKCHGRKFIGRYGQEPKYSNDILERSISSQLTLNNTWRYHIQKPRFLFGENIGVYEWCLSKVKKFDVGITIDLNTDSQYDPFIMRKEQYDCNKASDGWCYRDHIIDTSDHNYLSPEFHHGGDKNSWSLDQLYQDDLEHFWRNKDLILKESKIPDIKSTPISQIFELNDSNDENSEIFIDLKSRYK